jgi:phosphoglycerate dehydrogenase-like enzyme
VKIAILDDYQNVALQFADWSRVASKADITVFTDHLSEPDDVVTRLQPFDVLCVMRERTPLPRNIIERLPRLKMIASTGPGNASIDEQAAHERNIHITHTGYRSTPTIELTWALILASARNLVGETASLRAGGWQTSIGRELFGRVLGVLGLGRIGGEMARIGMAFGMDVIAWSQNLTPERARAGGAEWVSKEELFERSDVLTALVAYWPTKSTSMSCLEGQRRYRAAFPTPARSATRSMVRASNPFLPSSAKNAAMIASVFSGRRTAAPAGCRGCTASV